MAGRRKSARLERIMASLTRAGNLPSPDSSLSAQHGLVSGAERAWKRFVEEDVAIRIPGDLVRRLEAYARRVNAGQPQLNASPASIACAILNWALDQQQLTDIGMDIIGAALAAEGKRANQALELLQERLRELESFDARRLRAEAAELERLRQDLGELCVSLEQLTNSG